MQRREGINVASSGIQSILSESIHITKKTVIETRGSSYILEQSFKAFVSPLSGTDPTCISESGTPSKQWTFRLNPRPTEIQGCPQTSPHAQDSQRIPALSHFKI